MTKPIALGLTLIVAGILMLQLGVPFVDVSGTCGDILQADGGQEFECTAPGYLVLALPVVVLLAGIGCTALGLNRGWGKRKRSAREDSTVY